MPFEGSADEILDSRDLIAYAADETNREDDAETCDAIDDLAHEVGEWEDGATLIREDAFTGYAQELAADIGAIDDSHGWPLTYVDWERAADALKIDYTAVEFLGHTYYARS